MPLPRFDFNINALAADLMVVKKTYRSFKADTILYHSPSSQRRLAFLDCLRRYGFIEVCTGASRIAVLHVTSPWVIKFHKSGTVYNDRNVSVEARFLEMVDPDWHPYIPTTFEVIPGVMLQSRHDPNFTLFYRHKKVIHKVANDFGLSDVHSANVGFSNCGRRTKTKPTFKFIDTELEFLHDSDP